MTISRRPRIGTPVPPFTSDVKRILDSRKTKHSFSKSEQFDELFSILEKEDYAILFFHDDSRESREYLFTEFMTLYQNDLRDKFIGDLLIIDINALPEVADGYDVRGSPEVIFVAQRQIQLHFVGRCSRQDMKFWLSLAKAGREANIMPARFLGHLIRPGRLKINASACLRSSLPSEPNLPAPGSAAG